MKERCGDYVIDVVVLVIGARIYVDERSPLFAVTAAYMCGYDRAD